MLRQRSAMHHSFTVQYNEVAGHAFEYMAQARCQLQSCGSDSIKSGICALAHLRHMARSAHRLRVHLQECHLLMECVGGGGTAAGPDADLSIFRGHELHVVSARDTLTFEHTYTWWGESDGPLLPAPISAA